MNSRLLECLVSCVIPGSISTHHLIDAAVEKELFRLIEERAPGTRPDIDVTGGLIVVTWSGVPYEKILQACFPFSRTGLFTWQGEMFRHVPLFLRKTR